MFGDKSYHVSNVILVFRDTYLSALKCQFVMTGDVAIKVLAKPLDPTGGKAPRPPYRLALAITVRSG